MMEHQDDDASGEVILQLQALGSQFTDAMATIGSAVAGLGTQLTNAVTTLGSAFAQLSRAMLPIQNGWHGRHFAKTRNPLHAWQIYRLHRNAGENIPDWVLQYLDRSAEAVLEIGSSGTSVDLAPKISEAFGFKKPGRSGAGNVFSQFDEHGRWLDYALDIWLERHEGGQETYAIEAAAKKHGVSASTVRRAWADAKQLFPKIFY